jgi:hypothetical protein
MPRYLTVESEPVGVSCYTCGAGLAFCNYDRLTESKCPTCSTPLFLPHELEGIVPPMKQAHENLFLGQTTRSQR